jgi:ADP-ribose pyrophosphatase YjhB (NUDIX family)
MSSIDPVYRHCPRCTTLLEAREEGGVPRPTCPKCGFIHYRNPAPASGVLLLDGSAILLVRRKYAPRVGQWCLPAGFMEYGETPEACAVRELREETGLEAEVESLFGVFAGLDDPRVRAVLILYRVKRTGGELQAGDDATDAKFFPLDALPADIAFEAHRQALDRLRSER